MRECLCKFIRVAWVLVSMGVCAQEAPPTSRVRIQVTDSYGLPVNGVRIQISGSGVDLNATERDIVELRKGVYNVVAVHGGFGRFRSTVTIDQPEQILSIAMPEGAYEAPLVKCSLDGKVVPETTGSRVRALSIYGTEIRDVPLQRGGRFQFRNLECGSYLVLVTRETECLGLALPVLNDDQKTVVIPIQRNAPGDIPPCTLPVAHVIGRPVRK